MLLDRLGMLAIGRGDYPRAQALLAEALPLARSLGAGHVAEALGSLGALAWVQEEVGRAADCWCQGLVLARDIGYRLRIPQFLERLGRVARARGQLERAARLFGAAAVAQQAAGAPISQEIGEYERNLDAVRAQLGEAAFAAAWAEGQALPAEDAVAYAVADVALEPAVAEALGDAPDVAVTGAPVQRDPAGLTRREVEVLRLLAEGATDAAIAAALSISVNTVNKHVASILAKTGAANRTAAAAALRRRLP
jgi:DNA-binding CsgD family transcriptional regulator